MTHPDGRKEEYTLVDWLKDFVKTKFKRKIGKIFYLLATKEEKE